MYNELRLYCSKHSTAEHLSTADKKPLHTIENLTGEQYSYREKILEKLQNTISLPLLISSLQVRDLWIQNIKLLNFVQDSIVIEVHDLNKIQIYANSKFTDISQYDLVSLTKNTFEQLYLRSNAHAIKVTQRWEKAISNNEGLFFDFPEHNVGIRLENKIHQYKYIPIANGTVVNDSGAPRGIISCYNLQYVRTLAY